VGSAADDERTYTKWANCLSGGQLQLQEDYLTSTLHVQVILNNESTHPIGHRKEFLGLVMTTI